MISNLAKLEQPTDVFARFDERQITVYQAFSWPIAGPAVRAGRFVQPFSTTRLTWIKPSFLWMMHRSSWGEVPPKTHILAIDLRRQDWEELLRQAVITTPVAGLYPDKKRWRRMLDASPVRVQWDPDYDINDVRQPRRVIQVGIVPPMVAVYGKLPVKIRDITQEVHRIHGLVQSGQIASAKKLLPVEMPYPLSPSIRRVLAMALKP